MTSRWQFLVLLALSSVLYGGSCGTPMYWVVRDTVTEAAPEDSASSPLMRDGYTQGIEGTRDVDHLHRTFVPRGRREPQGYPYYVYLLMDESHPEPLRRAICAQLLTFFQGVQSSGGPNRERSALLAITVENAGQVREIAAAATPEQAAASLVGAYDYRLARRLREGLRDGLLARGQRALSDATLIVADRPLLRGAQPAEMLHVVDIQPRTAWELPQVFRELHSQMKAPRGRSPSSLISDFARLVGATVICWIGQDDERCNG
jgi:hypothetical protein